MVERWSKTEIERLTRGRYPFRSGRTNGHQLGYQLAVTGHPTQRRRGTTLANSPNNSTSAGTEQERNGRLRENFKTGALNHSAALQASGPHNAKSYWSVLTGLRSTSQVASAATELLTEFVQWAAIIVSNGYDVALCLPMPGISLCRTMGSRSPISDPNRFSLSR